MENLWEVKYYSTKIIITNFSYGVLVNLPLKTTVLNSLNINLIRYA
jgi:hypothetical protein